MRKTNEYVSPIKVVYNFNDLDDTPVKEHANSNEKHFDEYEERETLQKRFSSLNIKPLEIDENAFCFEPQTVTNRVINKETLAEFMSAAAAAAANKNEVSQSDTDSSIKAKCCANPLKLKW